MMSILSDLISLTLINYYTYLSAYVDGIVDFQGKLKSRLSSIKKMIKPWFDKQP